MKAPNEELLYFLMWNADALMRPTWRNLNDSFESWAWRNGLGRRLAQLERQKLIERHPEPNLDRVVRLTDEGRRTMLGGRNPGEYWSRAWDGQWRLVLFDLPTHPSDLRMRLWRTLRRFHFGHLQNSVWITPDSAAHIRSLVKGSEVQADAFLVIEGRPAAGESDAEIVMAAWDFIAINRRYSNYLNFLQTGRPSDSQLIEWSRRETALWKAAIGMDPLLPKRLLPENYLGVKALQARKHLLGELAQNVRKSLKAGVQ